MRRIWNAYENSPVAQLVVNSIPYIGTGIDAYFKAHARASASNVKTLQRLFGLRHGELWAICSDLNKGEIHLRPDPDECQYLGSYGDIYAFFELALALPRLIPRMNIRFASGWEFANTPGANYRSNLMLVGGPDFNEVTKAYMPYSPFAFEQDGDETVLVNTVTKQRLKRQTATDANGGRGVDYGFILKMPNPDHPKSTIYMFNGIRSQGVYGAVKCFLAQAPDERETAEANMNTLLPILNEHPYFAATLRVFFTRFMTCVPSIKLRYVMVWGEEGWRPVPAGDAAPVLMPQTIESVTGHTEEGLKRPAGK